MPTRPTRALPVGERVYLRAPTRRDAAPFLAAAVRSRTLHGRFVTAPVTPEAFARYLAQFAGAREDRRHAGFLVLHRDDDALVGVFNFSEIVRGTFDSAYLGYYAFRPHAARGLMREGLMLALDQAFGALALHRVEANVQPDNHRSVRLVTAAGFGREGYSRRYLKVHGRWRDHVRFAMLAEDWRRLRRGRTRTSSRSGA